MKEIEFNLLTEPWVRVRRPDNTVQEVSLTDALLHAQDYVDLAGEMPTQDAAVLRLLLAVLFTVFSRVDAKGKPQPLAQSDDALERWSELWQLGHFPAEPVRDYLEQWKDRFWLFHPTHPFWQVPQAKIGTEYGAAKLNGEMSESSNKLRLFPLYAGQSKEQLSYPQAARWLLCVNGYDDTSAKPKGKGLPSVGAGWLGKIGFIQAQGDNLYETLMLNLTLLRDSRECWGESKPCWELEEPKSAERTEICCPDNPAQLLTLQSRRLLLHRTGENVDGFCLLGGDFFPRENVFAEQMTIWRTMPIKKNEPVVFVPCRHDPAKQFWREFPAVFCQDSGHRPGVVCWIEKLQEKRLKLLDPRRKVHFRISASVFEEGKVYSVKRNVDETLCFAAIVPDYKLLTEAARAALPKEVSHKDAVYNLSRAALVPAAFCEGRHDLLAIATEDKLHQPYRMPLMPGSKEVFDMARLCGAKAVYVSGAGSTVMAVAEKAEAEKFYSKLEKGLELLEGLDGCEAFTLLRLDADNTGATVE